MPPIGRRTQTSTGPVVVWWGVVGVAKFGVVYWGGVG